MRSNTQWENRTRALVLTGPTSVGKTSLLSKLDSDSYEIINADSVQVYRDLSIGSAKPTEEERKRCVFHLVDFLDPKDTYTSGEFVKETLRLISEINERGRLPIISGGTIYYLKELLYTPSKAPVVDPSIREGLKRVIEERGLEWAYSLLKRVDSKSAERIHRNDSYRIERALEVYFASERPLSSYEVSKEIRSDIDFTLIAITRDKNELYERISKRVDDMFSLGLYEEVKALFERGADRSWGCMKAIGYNEFFEFTEGDMSLSDLKEMIKLHTRQYAKRQLTFLRSIEGMRFYDASELDLSRLL